MSVVPQTSIYFSDVFGIAPDLLEEWRGRTGQDCPVLHLDRRGCILAPVGIALWVGRPRRDPVSFS
jgi:hypothetical protein